MSDDDRYSEPQGAGGSPRRGTRRVLAVRMLVAKTAWLDGGPRWWEGRATWETPAGPLAPGPADLARATRSLNKLRQYPVSGRLALGDPDAWQRRRRERLELAKRLSALPGSDLPAVAEQARAGSEPALHSLAALLTAEALCLNPLPLSPAAALIACRERAGAALREALQDTTRPLAARALAALTLGALRPGRPSELPAALVSDAWLGRAYRWGRAAGLPEAPLVGLVTALLADEEGEVLARRCLLAARPDCPLDLSPELLRELLDGGVPARRVVELAEAAAEARPLADRLLARRHLLPASPLKDRQAVAARLQERGEASVAAVAELFVAYARATSGPEAVRLAAAVAHIILDLSPVTPALTDMLLLVLRRGLDLHPALRLPWLRLLLEGRDRFWAAAPLIADKPLLKQESVVHSHLAEQWTLVGKPVHTLLLTLGDPTLAQEALESGAARTLANFPWSSADLCGFTLRVARQMGVSSGDHELWCLCSLAHGYPSAAAARAALQPLLGAVQAAPPLARRLFLDELLYPLTRTRPHRAEMPARLARHVPRLLRFQIEEGSWEVCFPAIEAALLLEERLPEHAASWLDALLSGLEEWLRVDPGLADRIGALETGVRLGLAVAEGDLTAFLVVARAAVRHSVDAREGAVGRGLEMLGRFPTLRRSLARAFPAQPHRCVELLARLGQTDRLDARRLAPLAALESGTENADGGVAREPGWAELLALAPDLEPLAADYLRAQALLGGGGVLPPGLGRVLERPARLKQELAHLERRLAGRSNEALAARAASLRARLVEEERLQAGMREELRERLEQVTWETQLSAAERQVLACYRAQLEGIAGPLPLDLVLNADWINAALLSVNLTVNRRLLRRLLRARVAGERRWREAHPANLQFLQALRERGVDVEAWLAEHPRRYPCPAAAGGRVHVRLERDPLRILQMGSHFATCLSSDGCNAFSAVTNACELNKRVVYATDGAGRIVGRKLVALNEDGGLVGFHTYASLEGEAGSQALQAIFRHYFQEFAERCGLSLADDGAVSTLFAEDWYNDGIVSWEEEEPPLPGVKKGRSAESAWTPASSI